ncbi:hypothetical protein BJ741DRAFT_603515 [Chytriomyces cf. hyalinus JEL632]|nr:hypothetical protein BJ741DRAFT_603515 [Chytriomyces cf. hyalinus JEL632]
MADSRTLPLSRSDLLQLSKTCVQFVDARIMSSRSYSATLIRRISPLPTLEQDEDDNIFRQISTPSPLPRKEQPSSEPRQSVSPSSLPRRAMSPDRLERMDMHNRLMFQSRSTAAAHASESQRSLSLQPPSLSRTSYNSATESPSESVKYHERIDSLLDSLNHNSLLDPEPTFTVEPYSQAEKSLITSEIKSSPTAFPSTGALNNHIHPRTSSLHHHLRLHIGLVSFNAKRKPTKLALFKRKQPASTGTWQERVLISMDGLLLLFPVPSGGTAVPELLKRHGLVPVPLALMNAPKSHLNQLEAELVDFCARVLAERAGAVLDIMDICGMEVDDSCDFILRIGITSGHKGNFRSGGGMQQQQRKEEMDAAQLKFGDAVSRTHWKMIIQQMQER